MFERVLFVAGISMTVLASIGLCVQVYSWRTSCGQEQTTAQPSLRGSVGSSC